MRVTCYADAMMSTLTVTGALKQAIYSVACALGFSLASLAGFVDRSHAQDLRALVAQSKPSIVITGTYQRNRTPAFQARGTGFIVGDGFQMVTAAHVFAQLEGNDIERPALAVPHTSASGQPELEVRSVTPLQIDKASDIAVYRITEGAPLKPIKLAEGAPVDGTPVALIGFPLGLSLGLFHVSHRGMIAAVVPIAIPMASSAQLNEVSIRRLREPPLTVLQLDLTAYPGSSGSPVLDAESGHVVGLLSAGFVKGSKEAAISTPSGISYAIAARQINDVLKRAMRP